MDTLTQSHAYLSELASNPIQFGSNPMGSVSDSTDWAIVSALDRGRSKADRNRSAANKS
jgi:hypothetical protein